jgi:hypothetical protein
MSDFQGIIIRLPEKGVTISGNIDTESLGKIVEIALEAKCDRSEVNDSLVQTIESMQQTNEVLLRRYSEAVEALELADALLRGANMNRAVVENKVSAALAKSRGDK